MNEHVPLKYHFGFVWINTQKWEYEAILCLSLVVFVLKSTLCGISIVTPGFCFSVCFHFHETILWNQIGY